MQTLLLQTDRSEIEDYYDCLKHTSPTVVWPAVCYLNNLLFCNHFSSSSIRVHQDFLGIQSHCEGIMVSLIISSSKFRTNLLQQAIQGIVCNSTALLLHPLNLYSRNCLYFMCVKANK